jgi:hypothetical protein
MTMTEMDTITSDDVAAEIAQSAMFSDEEIERSSPVFLPGFEDLGRLTGQPVFADEEVIEAAMAYYRALGFPYRKLPMHVSMQQINQLAQTDDKNLLGTVVGYQVADTYHPHRFHSSAAGMKSPLESFESDKQLHRAIDKTLQHGAIGEEFLGMMAIVAGTQACSNFRPGFALSYYRRFCRRGGEVVLDTSTGYGGRLVGFLATNTRGTYIGIDPNVPTHEGNVRLMQELGVPKGYAAVLINAPAEDVDPRVVLSRDNATLIGMEGDGAAWALSESCDFAFTSPPYFSKEHYSEDGTQSWVRYGDDPTRWRDLFLQPMLRLQFAALKPGAYSCINIADVKVGKFGVVPLSDWTREAGIAAGFEYVHEDKYRLTRRMGAGASNGVVAYEPVHVFRKPESKVQIVKEGPVTAAEIAQTIRLPQDDTLCSATDCAHKFAKHDDEDGSCLVKTCTCASFETPWCSECGADAGTEHASTCPTLTPATAAQLNGQVAQDANIFLAERPIDEHVLCGEKDCSHALIKHDDDEGECLVKKCECSHFQVVCAVCAARDGEHHREQCSEFEPSDIAQAGAELAERLAVARASSGMGVEKGVVAEQYEALLDKAVATPTPEAPKWNCPVDDCVRDDKHVPGNACSRGAIVATQTEMPVAVQRRSATPPPAAEGKFTSYGAATEHCKERVEDGAGRPLSVKCRGCGAPRACWCNRG